MKRIFFYSSTYIHNIYQNMIANPPDGFQYDAHDFLAVPAASSNLQLRSIFQKLSPYYNYLHVLLGSPKIRKFDRVGYDMVHSTQSLLDSNTPYVLDFEHAAVFSGYNQNAFSNTSFVRNLKKILENKKLKKILPWTNAAKLSLTNFVNSDDISQKIEVVCPPVAALSESQSKRKNSNDGTIRFLFVGKVFFEKGGLDTLIAFDKLSQKYDVELNVLSTVPEDIKFKYASNKHIHFLSKLSDQDLKTLYQSSDVLVLPTHYDTFGFVIAEAFSYGIPVIADNSFCRPELVEHEKTGLLIDAYYSSFGQKYEYIYPTHSQLLRKRLEACKNPPQWYTDVLAAAMERMVTDGTFRKKCSENALKEATEGKFSQNVWKEKMKRIYNGAIE